jgi:hypothetical protein
LQGIRKQQTSGICTTTIIFPGDDDEMLAVHEALDQLMRHDAIKAELVKLKYFVCLTTEEAAGVLKLSVSTARRNWEYYQALVFRETSRVRRADA